MTSGGARVAPLPIHGGEQRKRRCRKLKVPDEVPVLAVYDWLSSLAYWRMCAERLGRLCDISQGAYDRMFYDLLFAAKVCGVHESVLEDYSYREFAKSDESLVRSLLRICEAEEGLLAACADAEAERRWVEE